MNRQYIKEKILTLLSNYNLNQQNLDENTYLYFTTSENNSIGMSSLNIVEFIVNLEAEFNIEYNFDRELHTIGDYINFVVEKKLELI